MLTDAMLTDRLRHALRSPRRYEGTWCTHAAVILLDVYALHLAPLEELDGAECWQHHPRVAALKARLEDGFRQRLDAATGARPDDEDAAEAFRRVARDELVPPVYDWLAEHADGEQLVEFLALEGGPDADFDDLVAICQVGLSSRPKLTLGANYWDEMGRGDLRGVHTELHRQMVDAMAMPDMPVDRLPLEALERRTLNGYLATSRARQPELLGSLGLLECQAGPRCRRVLAAMQRLNVPAAARRFYEEHALADPRHGKDWLEHAVVPLVEARPEWGPRILQGARWRALVNRRFFGVIEHRFGFVREAA